MRKILSRIYVIIVFIVLYAPIVVMIGLSFNNSKSRSVWGGFTLKWYKNLLSDEMIMSAFRTTIVLALLSAFFSVIIGVMAAVGMERLGRKRKSLLMSITNIPMLNADIVTGIAMMLLFVRIMDLSFTTVLIAHITFNIPYVIFSVLPKLQQTSKETYEAALDLGATPMYAFWKITFPDIFPGVLSGFLMAVTMSLDDFAITYFTKGADVNTLSTMIYTEARKGIRPEMYALSSLLFVTVVTVLFIINMPRKKKKQGDVESFE